MPWTGDNRPNINLIDRTVSHALQTKQTVARRSTARFWQRFTENAPKNGVEWHAVRWYVRHAETYLKAFPCRRLAQHTRAGVVGSLERQGELDRRIEDWQLKQMVDAVENLLRTVRAPAAAEVDWGFQLVPRLRLGT